MRCSRVYGWYPAQWLERLASMQVETILGLIQHPPTQSKGRQMKQRRITYVQRKNQKKSPQNFLSFSPCWEYENWPFTVLHLKPPPRTTPLSLVEYTIFTHICRQRWNAESHNYLLLVNVFNQLIMLCHLYSYLICDLRWPEYLPGGPQRQGESCASLQHTGPAATRYTVKKG